MKKMRILGLLVVLMLISSMGIFAAGQDEDGAEEVTVGFWDCGAWGDDEISEYIVENYGLQIEPINLSWADYLEKLNVMAATANLPDMFAHPGWSMEQARPTFLKWAREGVIKSLPDGYESDYPNIAKTMESYGFFDVDGEAYFIPRLAWQPGNDFSSQTLWVRTDWMENVGITEMPANLEELYDLLRAFTYDDPDGNGKDDTFGLTKGETLYWLFDAHGIPHESWVYENGEWIPSYVSEKVVDVLEFIQRLYSEGIIDPDYVTITREQGADRFASGRAGTICWATEAYHLKNILIDQMQKFNADWGPDVVDILPPTPAIGEDYMTVNKYNHWSGTMFSATMDDDKFAKVLSLFDFLLSPEGLELGRFGLEGVHFEKDGDTYKSLLPVDETTGLPKQLTHVAPTAMIKNFASWDVDGRWLEPSMPAECVDLEKKAISLFRDLQDKSDPRVQFFSTPAKDSLNYVDSFWEMFFKTMAGDADPESAFNDFKQNALEKKGVAGAIEEVNALADDLGITGM